MEPFPKVLLSSNSLASEMLYQFRLQAKNINILMEPNLPKLTERALVENPDLILLDLGLLEDPTTLMIRALREKQPCPMVVLLSTWNADSVLSIYDTGVDDCLVKPVDVKVLMAKVNAWLRRRINTPMEMLNFLRVGKTLLDPREKVLIVDESILIRLSTIELRLLYVLMSQAGRTLPTEELTTLIWKSQERICQTILLNTISQLRKKLESEPANLHCIYSVTGFGYKFDLPFKSGTGKLAPSQSPVEQVGVPT